MRDENKYALLIDAENVSSKYIGIVTKEAQSLGNITIRRIYGDWTATAKNSWKDSLLENSLSPIQQYSYTVRKNSSDSAMIIDAMDILYTNNVDGFIIVSSDSDFTKLAMRLRESGKRVIGMGESKTPTPFVRACEQFKTLDVLYKNHQPVQKNNTNERTRRQEIKCVPAEKALSGILQAKDAQSKDAQPITDLRAIKDTVISLLDENSDEDGWMYLSELGNMIQRIYSDFDCRNYGFAKFGKLIESFPELQTRKDDSSNGITKIVLVRKRED
ncbi:MAG: NYN domain-containing protein [Lachnospiraceae bacterium]|nr:NYN domain-containing protein [Lachnospiraceae bacterium]